MNYPIQKTDAEWQAHLAAKGAEPRAFDITRRAATERPYTGKYEQVWADGSYHCICCGNKLFDSHTKFDAGCGWPSFWKAIPGAITELVDRSHGMVPELILSLATPEIGARAFDKYSLLIPL